MPCFDPICSPGKTMRSYTRCSCSSRQRTARVSRMGHAPMRRASGGALPANSDLLHQLVGFAVGFRDPLDNLRGLG